MTQTNNIRFIMRAFIALVIAILFLTCFNQCYQIEIDKSNILALNDSISTYKLKNGQLVASKESILLDKAMAIDLVLSKDRELNEMAKKFSNIKTITKIVSQTKIDTMNVYFTDTIPCDFNKIGSKYEKWYSFDYQLNQKSFSINNLTIPDTLKLISGIKRKWFLGKETLVVDVMHKNPLIQVTNIQHVLVQPKKKFWETKLFTFSIGLAAGVYLEQKINH